MRNATKAELNKYLKSLDRDELEAEVRTLYAKFKDVQEYYDIELSGDSSAILTKYKAMITKEYFPTRGHMGQGRSSESRKAIIAFKNIAIFQKDVIDLLLHRVETMLKYGEAHHVWREAFLKTMLQSYAEACALAQAEKLEAVFRARCQAIVQAAHKAYYFNEAKAMQGMIDDHLKG